MATATTNTTPMWQTGAGTHLVYFSAPWCGHCKTFGSTWSQLKTTLASSHPNVTLVNVNDSETVKHTSPEVYAYPTLRVYHNGKMVKEFDSATDGDRNQLSNVTAFVQACTSKGTTTSRDIAGGQRRRRKSRRSRRNRTRQRGGGDGSGMQLFYPKGAASVPYPASSPAVGAPFDVPSNVPPAQQASSPTTAMPPPPYNAGLYTGKPFGGAWGNLPVTPTATAYTNQNLRSANPPPGATINYPTGATHRPGNSYSAMVGVNHYAKGGTGRNTIQCTPCHTSKIAKGGKRRRNASRRRRSKHRRARGGLALRSCNMDDGAPFHPQWSAKNANCNTCAQPIAHSSTSGGKRRSRRARTSRRRRARGGLALRSCNMDGAPFHPQWSAKNANCGACG